MTVSVLFVVGRFLLAVPFVLLGTDRALDGEATAAARLWGVLGLMGAAGVVLGAWGDVAAFVLAAAVLGGGIVECRADATDATRLRLVGLLGAAVVTAACFTAVGGALDLTLTDPVLDLDLR